MRQADVAFLAGASRVLLLAFAWLADRLVRNYDTSDDSAMSGGLPGALAHWDGVYFSAIAQRGYVWENELAFLPGFPLAVRLVAWALGTANIQLAALLLSQVCFVLAALALHDLGSAVLVGEAHARCAVLFFLISPASVFHLAGYSESLFAALCFAGFVQMHRGAGWRAAALFATASVVRSNGVLACGMVACHALLLHHRRLRHAREHVGFWLATACQCALIAAPTCAMQLASYWSMCVGRSEAERRTWCDAAVPSVYAFVQQRYWNNGLFKFYTWRQAPNFVIAAPLYVLLARALPLLLRRARPHAASGAATLAVVAVGHCLVLAATSAICMHVQVSVRFVCAASPVPFLLASLLWLDPATRPYERALLVGYFVLWMLLGVAMFVNFYPWT